MNRAVQVARDGKRPAYAPRIHELLERAQVRAARDLLAEALQENPSEPDLAPLRDLLAPPKAKASSLQDFDRTSEYLWLQAHAEDFREQWVALLGEALVTHAATLGELLSRLSQEAPDAPVLLHRIE